MHFVIMVVPRCTLSWVKVIITEVVTKVQQLGLEDFAYAVRRSKAVRITGGSDTAR